MRIVLTGATGFVGQPLARHLVARGHELVALSRDLHGATAKLPTRCRCVAWEPTSGRLDANAIAGADAIIHLAGEGVGDKPWTADRKQEILSSRTDTSRTLVSTIRDLAPARRPKALISASAIGFYGDRGQEVLDEQSAPGEGFLAEVCKAWEHETRAAADLGLRAAVIRIGIVLGKDGGALAKMLPPFQLGVGGRLGDGSHWMSWIHIDDLVALFAQAVESTTWPSVVNGVAPNPLTNADFTKALGAALRRPTLIPVPRFALNLALGEMSSLLFASQRVLPTAAQGAGFTFQYPTIDGALAQIFDGVHEIDAEQWIDHPLDAVFAFFSDARNLERLTPAFLKFRVLGSSTPTLRKGTLIDYQLSLHGLPIRWQSRIESWQAGKQFVDVQVRGPYRLWQHTHDFEEYRGGTIVRDRVRYQLPLGGFGDVLGSALVKRDLQQIFAFRRQQMREIFGAA